MSETEKTVKYEIEVAQELAYGWHRHSVHYETLEEAKSTLPHIQIPYGYLCRVVRVTTEVVWEKGQTKRR